MMRFFQLGVVVIVASFSTVVVSALPRGGKRNGGGIRSNRRLQKDNNMGGGGGGGGGGNGDGGLIEIHTCEPDPQAARDYVDIVGYPEQGDMDCYADPVNACPGGCCRFATYFICDTDNFAPHLGCVCNANTAPLPPEPAPVPVTPAPVPATTTPPVPATTTPPVPATTTTPPVADTTGDGGGGGLLPDIVDTAIAAGSFETLVSLLTTTGLADELRTAGPFTVFAPDDAAFQALAAEGGGIFDGLDDINVLTDVLLYHVIAGEILASDLTDGAVVTTLQGSNVTITLPPPMVNSANIIQTDIDTSNGIIHVIDGILIPGY